MRCHAGASCFGRALPEGVNAGRCGFHPSATNRGSGQTRTRR
ncbi:hypothetical protein SHJG_4263 [Streptomyces hygroscopicus subsp. jinggangensis 5008]|nr:hypothetical protein SHJG_4263 [Streptomyces hygroscopicus subsp. jinggangensis 5008]AGF63692.1 hypothetical protein SHJGH_4027 [Streptomyces hygroscopicus subsp. jinggangensis TL01]